MASENEQAAKGEKQSAALFNSDTYKPQWPALARDLSGAMVALLFVGNQKLPSWTSAPLTGKEFLPDTSSVVNYSVADKVTH